ncbi:PopZ family protein [Methylobacterium sp. JK268]
MEEILASIRRIIADDQKEAEAASGPAARPTPVPDDDPDPAEDAASILDLAEVAEPLRKPPLEEEPEIDFKDDPIDFDAIEIEPPPPPRAAATAPQAEAPPAPPAAPPQAAERLISRDTDASVSQAFNLLAHTVLTNNARTLEDLVQDMLRPMLKSWLDDNLPSLVERLVRAEIERVARGR